jgi:F-type H+-transporting ATPase subunit delta
LSERLAAIPGKQVVLTTEVDPSIIGGFVARIGDTLIDGSTKAKLEEHEKGHYTVQEAIFR